MTSSSMRRHRHLPVCAPLIAFVPLAPAGLALINTGFGRARGAALRHAFLTSRHGDGRHGLLPLRVFLGRLCRPVSKAIFAGRQALGLDRKGALRLRGLTFDGSPATLAMLLQAFTVGLAALIPISAGADRWRLRSVCISTTLLAGWTYPLFAHWVWVADGWRRSDVTSGWGVVSLMPGERRHTGAGRAVCSVDCLDPRTPQGKISGERGGSGGHSRTQPRVCPDSAAHSSCQAGSGLNAAGAILFAGTAPSRLALVAVNTMLSASGILSDRILATRIRFGKPDASLCADGWLGGLVASSAVCCFVTPATAIRRWIGCRSASDDRGGGSSKRT